MNSVARFMVTSTSLGAGWAWATAGAESIPAIANKHRAARTAGNFFMIEPLEAWKDEGREYWRFRPCRHAHEDHFISSCPMRTTLFLFLVLLFACSDRNETTPV